MVSITSRQAESSVATEYPPNWGRGTLAGEDRATLKVQSRRANGMTKEHYQCKPQRTPTKAQKLSTEELAEVLRVAVQTPRAALCRRRPLPWHGSREAAEWPPSLGCRRSSTPYTLAHRGRAMTQKENAPAMTEAPKTKHTTILSRCPPSYAARGRGGRCRKARN